MAASPLRQSATLGYGGVCIEANSNNCTEPDPTLIQLGIKTQILLDDLHQFAGYMLSTKLLLAGSIVIS